MSLENIEPIQIVDISSDKSFIPYIGLERDSARALARDFARQQAEIYAAARNMKGDGAVTWTGDGKWVYVDASTFEIISRKDNKFNLNLSKDDFAKQIADGLGVNTQFYLGVEGGVRYFFDTRGNFGKVSGLDYYEPDCIEAFHASTGGYYFYKKEQMQAGDFEYVGFMLSKMREGLKSIQTATENP